MRSTPYFPVRDLKFEEITTCALEDWDLPKLKNQQLEYVAANFRANIARVRHLMILPTMIAGNAVINQRTYDIAEYEITGSLTRDQMSLPPEIMLKIDERAKEMLATQKYYAEAQQGSSEWDASVRKFHSSAGYALAWLCRSGRPIGDEQQSVEHVG